MKSRIDVLLDRYVLTEKTLEVSKIFFNLLDNSHLDAIKFIAILDSNKLVVLTYPDDKHVRIHLRIVLRSSEFDTRVVDACNVEIKRRFGLDVEFANKIRETQGTFIESVETFEKHFVFGYKIVATGTAVLDEILKGRFENSMRLEAMRIERSIVHWGR